MIIYCPKCINPSGQGTISISGYPMYCEKHIDKTLPTITIIQNNLVDEATLREQIARGILEIGIPELPQGHEDNPTFIAIRTAQEVMRLRAAAIARGK